MPAGRPSFQPTADQRRHVEEMLSCGMSQDAAARVIGIDDKTFRKHFEDEIANGAARKKAELIGLLYESARLGKVSAIRTLKEMMTPVLAEQAFMAEASKEPVTPKVPKLGKKELAAEAAAAAGVGTEWGEDLHIGVGAKPN